MRVAHVSGALFGSTCGCGRICRAVDADVFLVELKAAAVDVVVEEAVRRGIRVVIAANDVVPLHDEVDLDSELERLAAEATALVPEIGAAVPRAIATSRRCRWAATMGRRGRRACSPARWRQPGSGRRARTSSPSGRTQTWRNGRRIASTSTG